MPSRFVTAFLLASLLIVAVLRGGEYAAYRARQLRSAAEWQAEMERQLDLAVEGVDHLTDPDPEDAAAFLRRSVMTRGLATPYEALTRAEQSLQLWPDSAALWEQKGRALWVLITLERDPLHVTVGMPGRTVEIRPPAPDQPSYALRFDEVIAAFRRTLWLDPSRTDIYRELIDACYAMGRTVEALALYREAQVALPGCDWVWSGYASLLPTVDPDARDDLQQLGPRILRDSTDWRQWVTLGRVMSRLSGDSAAVAAYQQALALHPADASLWLQTGWLLRRLHRYADELECADQAARHREPVRSPRYESILNLRADALLNLERYAEALAAADSACVPLPHFDNPWRVKGMALFHLGRVREAESPLERAYDIEPSDKENPRDLAVVKLALGNAKAALTLTEEAQRWGADDAITWETKGIACFGLERYSQAASALAQTVSRDESRDRAFYYSARVQARLLDRDQARAHLARAIALNPAWQDSLAFDPLLQQLVAAVP